MQQPLSDMVDGIKKGNEAEMNQALSVMKSEIKKARVDKSQACVCLQMILRHAGSCWEALSSENEDLFHKREILMGRVTEQKTFKEAFKGRGLCSRGIRKVLFPEQLQRSEAGGTCYGIYSPALQ